MSLIEKAVERLDQLKQAGVEVPEAAPKPVASAAPAPSTTPMPEARQTPPPAKVRISQPEKHRVQAPASASEIVEIDLPRLAAMGMVTPDQPRSPAAEEYRLIKRPVLNNAQGKGAAVVEDGNLIMVTSSLPGEGKSFTTINLAISMAMELDYTVLLVDADVSKPSVLDILGMEPAKGLMDVLLGREKDLANVLLRTNIEKLSILPAGMPHPNATELLASDAMNRLLEEMASRYSDRIIVFDSPPLLVTTEAPILASHMGQIIMVVEANRTSQSVVRQALAKIESCPVKMMLLNKANEGSSAGYGYGYAYGYGYGASEGGNAEAA